MEITKPNESILQDWKGYDWQVAEAGSIEGATLWCVGGVDEVGYDKAVANLSRIIPQAVQEIKTVFPDTPPLNVEVAVFPQSQYRDKLDLAPDIPGWVQVCVRDDRVCYEQSLVSPWVGDLADVPAEQRRELIHEFLHPTLRALLNENGELPLTFAEGMVEAVPRLVLGYQRGLPASTAYLTGGLRAELVSPADMDANGLFYYSQNPLSSNRGYMSAFAYVTGVVTKLDDDFETGLKKLVGIIKSFNSEVDFYDQLSVATGISTQELLLGKDLQDEGLRFIESWVHGQVL